MYLECHVLQKVGSAVVLGIFSTATGIDEDANSGGLDRGVGLCGDRQAILERGDAGTRDLSSGRGGKGANSLKKNDST